MVLIEIEVPDPPTIKIQTLEVAALPTGWDAAVAPDENKDIGTQWALAKDAVMLSVPSAIVSIERNYLVNPLHPDIAKIRFAPPRTFVFDPRLKDTVH
jgi:RES domain-containing protein